MTENKKKSTNCQGGCYMDLTPGSGNSIPIYDVLHVTVHSIPKDHQNLRILLLSILMTCWVFLYPRPIQLRSIIFAVIWTFVEPALTYLAYRRFFTSLGQFLGNLIYIPVLLDVYSYYFLDPTLYNTYLYVLLFPLNVWLLELVLGRLFVLIYGRNIAWCYCKASDSALNGTIMWSHVIQWWALGLGALVLYPPFKEITDQYQ